MKEKVLSRASSNSRIPDREMLVLTSVAVHRMCLYMYVYVFNAVNVSNVLTELNNDSRSSKCTFCFSLISVAENYVQLNILHIRSNFYQSRGLASFPYLLQDWLSWRQNLVISF